jgi:hypothetical protein
VASVAVAGWTLMGLAYKSREPRVKGQQPESVGTDFDGLISAGAWIALVASLAQLAVGLWVLIEMPITTRNLLLGSNWLGTGLFFVAIVATFGLLHMLATVAVVARHRSADGRRVDTRAPPRRGQHRDRRVGLERRVRCDRQR